MEAEYVPMAQYKRLVELHDNQKKIISKLQEENQTLKQKILQLEQESNSS